MSAVHLHLNLLGPFRLRQGDQPVAGFDHARLQHLLAYLALYRAAPISGRQLAFLFWPDSTDQQALANLRTLLTRLRHALPDADHFIDVTAQTIPWHPDELRWSGVLVNGIEKANVKVTLANKIPPEDCARLNLGYLDPASINPADWQNREDEGILYVASAGEMLYKVRK